MPRIWSQACLHTWIPEAREWCGQINSKFQCAVFPLDKKRATLDKPRSFPTTTAWWTVWWRWWWWWWWGLWSIILGFSLIHHQGRVLQAPQPKPQGLQKERKKVERFRNCCFPRYGKGQGILWILAQWPECDHQGHNCFQSEIAFAPRFAAWPLQCHLNTFQWFPILLITGATTFAELWRL